MSETTPVTVKPVVVSKPWYMSKTIWLNVIGLILILVQSSLGIQFIPIQYQTIIIAFLNLAVRSITTTNLTL